MRQLTDEEQAERREAVRKHWHASVPFNNLCGTRIERWETDGVTVLLPYAETLTAHARSFHGGAISALIDIAATGAVMAGHDFTLGPAPVTLALSVQYIAMVDGESIRAIATCRKRGRTNFVDVDVLSVSGTLLAQGLATVGIVAPRNRSGDAQ